jgi:hypothetical protein
VLDRGTCSVERPLHNQENLEALLFARVEDILQKQLVSTAAPSMYCIHARILGIHEKSEYYDEEAERKGAMRDQDLELRPEVFMTLNVVSQA